MHHTCQYVQVSFILVCMVVNFDMYLVRILHLSFFNMCQIPNEYTSIQAGKCYMLVGMFSILWHTTSTYHNTCQYRGNILTSIGIYCSFNACQYAHVTSQMLQKSLFADQLTLSHCQQDIKLLFGLCFLLLVWSRNKIWLVVLTKSHHTVFP